MAEVFDRINLGPSSYSPNVWTQMYKAESEITGTLIFDFSITNITPLEGLTESEIEVSVKIINKNNVPVQYIIPAHVLSSRTSWDSAQKIILKPGDKLMVQANKKGICFYASIITGLKISV